MCSPGGSYGDYLLLLLVTLLVVGNVSVCGQDLYYVRTDAAVEFKLGLLHMR